MVRIVFIVLGLATGVFVAAYILAWIIVPKRELGADDAMSASSSTSASTSANAYSPAGPQMPRQYSSWTRYMPGLILILIGVILLFQDTFYWFDLKEFWPLVLIVLGLAMIVGRNARQRARSAGSEYHNASTHNGGSAS